MDQESREWQRERVKAAHAKALMMRPGLSISRAARVAGTTPEAVLRHFGRSITFDRRSGRYLARADDEVFRMQIVSIRGVVEADVRGSEARSTLYWHGRAIDRALDPGFADVAGLRRFEGVEVAGYRLETDINVLEGLWLEGAMEFLVQYLDAE